MSILDIFHQPASGFWEAVEEPTGVVSNSLFEDSRSTSVLVSILEPISILDLPWVDLIAVPPLARNWRLWSRQIAWVNLIGVDSCARRVVAWN